MAFKQNSSFSGLGTAASVIVPAADSYNVSGKITLPTIVGGSSAQSAVVVVVNKNGSPVYTGSASARGFSVVVNCAASDLITVVLSSSAPVDQEKNVIRSVISIDQGEI